MSLNKRLMSTESTPAIVPSEHFGIKAYTGNGSTQNITGVGFQPDLVWLKEREGTNPQNVWDSSRGAGKLLVTSTTAAESGNAGDLLGSFDADGFQVNRNYDVHTAYDNTNYSGSKYIAWCWKANGGTTSSNSNGSITSTVQANDDAGFSIVQYDGNVTAGATIGHGLSAAPDLIILTNRTRTGYGWLVYHSGVGATKAFALNNTDAVYTGTAYFNDTAPTSTVFSLGSDTFGNSSGYPYIAYCWRNVDGYSKFDSYTGNGDTFGPIIETGFEVGWLIIKRVDSGDNWLLFDNVRHGPTNNNLGLIPNSNAAESAGNLGNGFTFLSNGFQVVSSDSGVNANSGEYVYMAFATDPDTVAPTLADSFNIRTYTGDGNSGNSHSGLGFSPDLVWMKGRSQQDNHYWQDSVRGASLRIYSNSTAAEYAADTNRFTSFDSDGFTVGSDNSVNMSNETYVTWCWKANDDDASTINDNGSIDSITSVNANAGFSVIKYTGNGSGGATIGHGLSSAPEVTIIKKTSDTEDWYYQSEEQLGGWNKNLRLNTSESESTSTTLVTGVSATLITLGTSTAVNGSSTDYIVYCWHSVSGYSKISSYSGTGSSNAITGLGFQPDWIMIKEVDGTDSWEILDSVRGANKVVYANGDNAEGTSSNFTSFDSDGFTVSSATSVNESGKEYIYTAFKIN